MPSHLGIQAAASRRRPAGPADARRVRLALAAILAGFCLLGATYAVVTPLFEVSDELWHYPMVKTLADGNGLPVQMADDVGPWRQEGSQPPLYYALMALATAWIDTSDIDQVRWVNPHADNGLITPDGNNNIVVHTYREAWPWRGTVLAVRLIRLLSVLMGAATVYFTFRLGLELAPERPALGLAAAAFAAFTPMFLFISASINNDNLAIALSAGALWWLVRWLRAPPEAVSGQHVAVGACLGGAVLSKESALGLVPLAGAVLLLIHARAVMAGRDWRAAGRQLALQAGAVFGAAAAISGWWYWRNYQLYGDWLGWNVFIEIVGRRPTPASLAQLWGERVGFVQAYWGLFGGVSVPMPSWAYATLNVGMGLALVGLGWGLAQASARRLDLQRAVRWGVPVAWLALLLIGLVRWTSITWASQGRLIFPALSAVSVLAVAGLARLWRPLPWLMSGFMAVLAAAVPFTVIGPHYRPPPELSPTQRAAIAHPLDVDFGGEMRLLGYELQNESVRPGEAVRLTLYWQSLIAMDRNWSIFVHLVDDQDIVVAQRDRYPGMGALATTLLCPGQTFADQYVIPVPEGTYAPVAARIEVGLYDLRTGERLPLADGGDALTLTPLLVEAVPGQLPNTSRWNFDHLIRLAGYHMDRRTLRPGDTLHLTLHWQSLAPTPVNYSVFAHVRGEGETLWAGEDAWPQQGASPTSTWIPGDQIEDAYALTLRPDTPPGVYDVEVGLYDGATLGRLRVIAPDGRPTDADFVYLSKIRVIAP